MCGIAAIFSYHSDAPPVDREELLRIRERMISRGPDGAGEWLSDNREVGLAHRRLSIIDLSEAGSQPMANADGSLIVTFNGEIYNYQALRSQLSARGYHFRSTSDTEVLLHLYAEKGPEMVHDLRGMYAFAIWDERKNGLFLARDPFGIKPLYYADDGRTFRAASQVKALLAGGRVETAPEPAGHVGFFLWGHVPEPYTLYKGIRSLTAGSWLWVGQDSSRESRVMSQESSHKAFNSKLKTQNSELTEFCSIQGELKLAEQRALSLDGPARRERLREALCDTVRHHLVADVPVGVFLSSGLDSTTLAALAAEAGGNLQTVTLGFREYRGTEQDETILAEKVARQYGARHQTIWIEKQDFRDEYGRLVAAMDQPTIDGVNSYFISKAAVQAGLKVAISGLGGDELFGGYPSFRQIPRMVGTLGPLAAVPGLGRALRMVSAPLLKHFTSPKYAGLLEYGGSFSGAYLLRRGMFMPWELPEFLDGDMVREGWRELQTMVRLDETVQGVAAPHFRISALEMGWYMRNQLLRDTDWASMSHSLEVRVPLVDLSLLQTVACMFSYGEPPTKLAMAGTPGKPLPAEVLKRGKTGFCVPVRDWLLEGRDGGDLRGLRRWAMQVYGEFDR